MVVTDVDQILNNLLWKREDYYAIIKLQY